VSIPIPRARICGAFPFSRSSTDRANLARARTRNTYYVCTFVRTYVRMCVCVCLSHMRANPRVHECRNIIVAGLIHRNAAPKVANVGSAKLTNSPLPLGGGGRGEGDNYGGTRDEHYGLRERCSPWLVHSPSNFEECIRRVISMNPPRIRVFGIFCFPCSVHTGKVYHRPEILAACRTS